MHDVAPAVLYVPAGHSVPLADVAPTKHAEPADAVQPPVHADAPAVAAY